MSDSPAPVDPTLLTIWSNAWAQSRAVPPPVCEGTVLTTEVGLPDQQRRHLLLEPPNGLAELAARITTPHRLIKAPMAEAAMRAALPPAWRVERTGTFMTIDRLVAVPTTQAAGLDARWRQDGETVQVDLCDPDDNIAAPRGAGRLTVIGRHAIFDQIVVAPAYRRQGVGRAIMAALTDHALAKRATTGLLTATDAGRALYEKLGWRALSPWITAQIPVIRA